MKGDVIELCLAPCRETAYAVNCALREARLAFNQLRKDYDDMLEHILKLVFYSGEGPPILKQCPDPERLVMTIKCADAVVQRAGRRDADGANAQFQKACEDALDSIEDPRFRSGPRSWW